MFSLLRSACASNASARVSINPAAIVLLSHVVSSAVFDDRDASQRCVQAHSGRTIGKGSRDKEYGKRERICLVSVLL